MKRSDWWRYQYHDDRYMEGMDATALKLRLRDVLSNTRSVTDDLKLGMLSTATSGPYATNYWMVAFTHLLEEFGARGSGLPGDPDMSTMPKLDWPGLQSAIPIFQSSRARHPEVLVRYSSHDRIESAYEQGSIFINPASRFSDPSLNAAVRDDELSLTVYRRSSLFRTFYDEFGRALHPPGPALGHKTEVLRAPTNYYVYCMSMDRSPRLFGDFNANAALIIHDVRRFIRQLGETVRKHLGSGWTWIARPVRYIDPLRAHPGPLNIFESKLFLYTYQHEFRVVWVPPNPVMDLKPFLVSIPPLKTISTAIKLRES
jgi:hypothetical protein